MCSQWAALAMSAVAIMAAVAKPLAPPTTGWLYTIANTSFVFPFTAAQCQPFNIFYNNTGKVEHFFYYDATTSYIVFTINVPNGIGYLEWICNIPAGFAFFVGSSLNYIVQAGTSSACLGNITTTYSLLGYRTPAFSSYTQTAFPLTSLPTNTFPTTTFPTGAYLTITLNQNQVDTPTTSLSSPVAPSTSSPIPSHKLNKAAVFGSVVGVVAFILLVITIVLWWRRKRSVLGRASAPTDPRPASVSELVTGELGSRDLSSPSGFFGGRWSSTEFLSGTPQFPFSPPDPCSRRTESTSDNPITAPMTDNPAAHVGPIVRQRPSLGAITPLETESSLPSQRLREASDGVDQASFPKPVPDFASRAPATGNPQPSSAQHSDAPGDAAPEISVPDAAPLTF